MPKIKGEMDTKESVEFGLSISRQSNWDAFWGNAYLGIRLDTSVGAGLGLSNQMATTGLSKDQSVDLKEDEWKESQWYREGLKYSEGMSSYRAKLLADDYDDIRYQRYLNTRSTGLGSGLIKFAGRMLGQVVDPINYIPFIGTGYKALKLSAPKVAMSLAKTSAGKKVASSAALRGAIEVGVGTAAVQPFLSETAKQIGEERVWQQVVADIAIGAAFGGTMGKVFGKQNEMPLEPSPKKPTDKSENISFLEQKSEKLNNIYEKIDNNTNILRASENKLKDISKIEDKTELKSKISSLYKENEILREDAKNIIGDLDSFSQDIQINSTKAFSSSVINVINGTQADLGESGLKAINDMFKQYGIKEVPVAEKIRPTDFIKEEFIKELPKYDDSSPKIEMPKDQDILITDRERNLMSQEDIADIESIDIKIKESNMMEDIMTLANNCFGSGKV